MRRVAEHHCVIHSITRGLMLGIRFCLVVLVMGLTRPAVSDPAEPPSTADSSTSHYAPSAEWPEAIRRSAGRKPVRIHLERHKYEIEHAR